MTKKKPSISESLIIIKQLRFATKHHVPLPVALQSIQMSQLRPMLKKELDSCILMLKKGHSFLQSFSYFLPKQLAIVNMASDHNPQIDALLQFLDDYLTNKAYQRNLLRKKMKYPISLIMLSMVLLILFITTLMPKYIALFQTLNISLPKVLLWFYYIQDIEFDSLFFTNIMSNKSPFFIFSALGFMSAILMFGFKYVAKKSMALAYKFITPIQADLLWCIGIFSACGYSLNQTVSVLKSPSHYVNNAFNQFTSQFCSTAEFVRSFDKGFPLPRLEKEILLYAEAHENLNETIPSVAKWLHTKHTEKIDYTLTILPNACIGGVFLLILLFVMTTFLPIVTSLTAITI